MLYFCRSLGNQGEDINKVDESAGDATEATELMEDEKTEREEEEEEVEVVVPVPTVADVLRELGLSYSLENVFVRTVKFFFQIPGRPVSLNFSLGTLAGFCFEPDPEI